MCLTKHYLLQRRRATEESKISVQRYLETTSSFLHKSIFYQAQTGNGPTMQTRRRAKSSTTFNSGNGWNTGRQSFTGKGFQSGRQKRWSNKQAATRYKHQEHSANRWTTRTGVKKIWQTRGGRQEGRGDSETQVGNTRPYQNKTGNTPKPCTKRLTQTR